MTRPLHLDLLLLSAEYPPTPGGVGDYTHRLGQALARRGHMVAVATIRDGMLTLLPFEQNGEQITSLVVGSMEQWGWGSLRTISTMLAAIRPRWLHVQYQTGAYGMHPAITFLPRWVHSQHAATSTAVTAHDLLPPFLFPKAGPLRGWVTRRLLTDADLAVTTNGDDYWRVAAWRGRRPTCLVPIGSNIPVAPSPAYDRAMWRADLGVAEDTVLVAYFGLLSASKGLDVLIDALGHVPHARLLVIGGEAPAAHDQQYAQQIRALIAEEPLARQVIWVGHASEADVSGHLLAADVAALPFADGASFRRGSLLAALTHGVPIITTTPHSPLTSDIGGARLADGVNALLVPPGDAVALAGAIERLRTDSALRARIGAAGRALGGHFTWDAIAQHHETAYARQSSLP